MKITNPEEELENKLYELSQNIEKKSKVNDMKYRDRYKCSISEEILSERFPRSGWPVGVSVGIVLITLMGLGRLAHHG